MSTLVSFLFALILSGPLFCNAESCERDRCELVVKVNPESRTMTVVHQGRKTITMPILIPRAAEAFSGHPAYLLSNYRETRNLWNEPVAALILNRRTFITGTEDHHERLFEENRSWARARQVRLRKRDARKLLALVNTVGRTNTWVEIPEIRSNKTD